MRFSKFCAIKYLRNLDFQVIGREVIYIIYILSVFSEYVRSDYVYTNIEVSGHR
jgi:hypothetical protein